MRWREFLGILGGVVAWPVVARAEQPDAAHRIGVLVGLTEDDADMVAL
jgi:hypothetical protein